MNADRHDNTVTVLGAGIAGLAAAWQLEQHGYRVEVLEGSGRLGGRIYSHRFGSGPDAPVAELGAMRIPAQHTTTLGCIDRLGLTGELRPFRSLLSSGGPLVGTRGGHLRPREAAVAPLAQLRAALPPGRYGERTLHFGAQLTVLVDAVAPASVRRGLRRDLHATLLDRVERLDLHSYLGEDDQLDLHRIFAAHPHLHAGCSGDLSSFLDDVLTGTGDDLLRIRGGMNRLTDRLADRLSRPVLLDRQVIGIGTGQDGVAIQVRQDGRAVTYRSRYAICTIPFPVLRRLRLTGFSSDKLDVLREVRYAPATKIALHCRQPFWHRTGIPEGAASSGGRIRQTYYPAVDGDPARGAVLLASYTIGEDTDPLDRLPVPQRVMAVLGELADIHPELRQPGMVRGAASIAWGRHPWSGGGCTIRWGKDAAAVEDERRLAARPEQSLFFAGEHCSATPAWIEGALRSAHETVEQLVARDAGLWHR
jgi:monoamine oxidase